MEFEFVYAVIENGEAYQYAYKTYASAVKAVNDRHKDELDRQIQEIPDYKEQILGDVNPKEDPSGKTFLYIEKEIHIHICKLPVVV
jgi:hypothetical protein